MNFLSIVSSIITALFLLVVCSYYVLFFLRKPSPTTRYPKTITILIPMHNEAKHIARCIRSVLDAQYPGKKQIIVIDDGSSDASVRIASQFPVTVLRRKHLGKAAALNAGLALAKHPLLAVVDGDSEIAPSALKEAAQRFHHENVAAVCAAIRVKNRHSLIGFYVHLEQLYGSLSRSLLSRINANIVAAGPLTVFRTKALREIDGFATQGYAEDVDIAVRLNRAGWVLEYAEKSFVETTMPTSPQGFLKQRRRFARGWVAIFRKHLKADHSLLQIYTVPLAFFGYFQAVVMGGITLYNVSSGYIQYFASKGTYFSSDVARYLIDWLSIVGLVKWSIQLFSGSQPWTIAAALSIAAALLSYPLYLIAAIRFDRIHLGHLVAIAFLFPFWLVVMTVYILNIDAWFVPAARNKWEK